MDHITTLETQIQKASDMHQKIDLMHELSEELQLRDIAAVATSPIRWRHQMLGVLNFVRYSGRPFSQASIELAELFAAQAAIAIQNTTLLNKVQEFATDLQLEIIERKLAEEELRVY